MKHTQEPWFQESAGAVMHHGEHGNKVVCDTYETLDPDEREANAARIVACVNGCTGFNPAAYRECVETLKDLLRVIDSLEGVEYSRDYERPDQASDHWHMVIENATKALALAEGGQA